MKRGKVLQLCLHMQACLQIMENVFKVHCEVEISKPKHRNKSIFISGKKWQYDKSDTYLKVTDFKTSKRQLSSASLRQAQKR